MDSTNDQARVTTASAEEIAAAADAVPIEARPAVPMQHGKQRAAPVIIETSGNAAAEASGRIEVDNDASPAATAGSG